MKKKLCFCLREFDPNIDGHGKYIYETIIELSKIFDLIVVVEKGRNQLIEGKTICMKSNNKFFLLIENFYTLLKLRMKGHKTFYSHYTIFSRINIGLITTLFGGRSYFWHCARIADFKKEWHGFDKYKKYISDFLPFKISCALNNYLVTGNETMKSYYFTETNQPKSKIKVCPNWVDARRFKKANLLLRSELNISQDVTILLFVHRLAQRKGAEDLPEILEGILKKRKDIILLVIGDGPLREYLFEKLPQNYSRIIGPVANEKIPPYFALSDIFIMPSHQEGFPRVLLESMAANTPFVATNVGGAKEISPPGYKYIVEKKSNDIFISKTLELLEDTRKGKNKPNFEKHLQQYSKETALSILTSILTEN